MPPGVSLAFAPVGGRGTNFAFPYYNLEMLGGGLILAVGWPGQWAARFARDGRYPFRSVPRASRPPLFVSRASRPQTKIVNGKWQMANGRKQNGNYGKYGRYGIMDFMEIMGISSYSSRNAGTLLPSSE